MRCCTCGNMLSDKWIPYTMMVNEIETAMKKDTTLVLPQSNPYPLAKKSVNGVVMDILGLKQICCRLHILTNADILDKL